MLRHSVNHMVFLGLRLEMWNIERANRIERRDERVIQLAAAAGGAQLLPHLSQRPQHPCRSNRCPWQCSQKLIVNNMLRQDECPGGRSRGPDVYTSPELRLDRCRSSRQTAGAEHCRGLGPYWVAVLNPTRLLLRPYRPPVNSRQRHIGRQELPRQGRIEPLRRAPEPHDAGCRCADLPG